MPFAGERLQIDVRNTSDFDVVRRQFPINSLVNQKAGYRLSSRRFCSVFS
jgi:hypothetical protein